MMYKKYLELLLIISLASCNDTPKSLLESDEASTIENSSINETKNHSLSEEKDGEEIELVVSSRKSIESMISNFVTESSDKDELLALLTKMMSAVNKATPKVTIDPDEDWKKFDSLKPHIISILEKTDEVLELHQIKPSEELKLIQADLYSKLGNSNYYNAYYSEAVENHQKSLDILLDITSKDINIKKYIAKSYRYLRNAYWRQGKIDEVHKNCEKHLTIILDVKKDYPNDLNIKKELAESYHGFSGMSWYQKNYTKAIEYQKKALNITSDILKINPSDINIKQDIAKIHHRFGIIYRTQGKLNQSLKHYKKALDIQRDIYKDNLNHPYLAQNYSNLAYTYIKKVKVNKIQGDYVEMKNNSLLAGNNLTKAYNILKANDKNKNQMIFSWVFNGLGKLYEVTGEFDKSVDNYKKSFETRKKITPDHPSTAKNEEDIKRVKSYVEIQKIVSSSISDAEDQTIELKFKKEINLDHIKSYFENVLTAEIKDLETNAEGNTTVKIHFDDRVSKILDFLKREKE